MHSNRHVTLLQQSNIIDVDTIWWRSIIVFVCFFFFFIQVNNNDGFFFKVVCSGFAELKPTTTTTIIINKNKLQLWLNLIDFSKGPPFYVPHVWPCSLQINKVIGIYSDTFFVCVCALITVPTHSNICILTLLWQLLRCPL